METKFVTTITNKKTCYKVIVAENSNLRYEK